jgi:hypothetical protein
VTHCPVSTRRHAGSALILLLGTAPALADDGWRLMFEAVQDRLPESDQQAIYARLGFVMAPDSATLLVTDAPEAGPVGMNATVRDLNGDGQDEVFLVGGNLFTSGGTGSSVWLFIKQATDGNWQMNLGFPAAAYVVLEDGHAGFPNLQIAGMGFCEAVWRWDGTTYQHHRNVPTAPDGCQWH